MMWKENLVGFMEEFERWRDEELELKEKAKSF